MCVCVCVCVCVCAVALSPPTEPVRTYVQPCECVSVPVKPGLKQEVSCCSL